MKNLTPLNYNNKWSCITQTFTQTISLVPSLKKKEGKFRQTQKKGMPTVSEVAEKEIVSKFPKCLEWRQALNIILLNKSEILVHNSTQQNVSYKCPKYNIFFQ